MKPTRRSWLLNLISWPLAAWLAPRPVAAAEVPTPTTDVPVGSINCWLPAGDEPDGYTINGSSADFVTYECTGTISLEGGELPPQS